MMRKILTVLGMVAGLATGAVITQANAAVVPLSTSSNTALNLGDLGTYGASHAPGSFTDNWLFTVNSSGTGSGGVVDAVLQLGLVTFDNTNLLARIVDQTLGGTQVGVTTGANDSASAFAANLITGHQYAVQVSGNATGSAGGIYNGLIQLSGPLPPAVVPVPPALLLFGSALTGLFCIGRRKKIDSAA